MNPTEKGKQGYGGNAEDFDGYRTFNGGTSIEPKFSEYMQTSLGYAKYGSGSTSGFKNPNPQSPIPVVKK